MCELMPRTAQLTHKVAVLRAVTTGDNAQIYGNEEEYRNYVLGPLHEFIAKRPFWPFMPPIL